MYPFINFHRCYRFKYFAVSKKCIPKYTEVIKRTLLFTNTPFSSSKTIILFFFSPLLKKSCVPIPKQISCTQKDFFLFFYSATAFHPLTYLLTLLIRIQQILNNVFPCIEKINNFFHVCALNTYSGPPWWKESGQSFKKEELAVAIDLQEQAIGRSEAIIAV